jgi:hypothetical protein
LVPSLGYRAKDGRHPHPTDLMSSNSERLENDRKRRHKRPPEKATIEEVRQFYADRERTRKARTAAYLNRNSFFRFEDGTPINRSDREGIISNDPNEDQRDY